MKGLKADSSSPLYHQLMQRIAADIDRGTYPVGSRIPPEHELEQLYQVSRVTVRRALAELTSEGLLERKQGKGTFVSMPQGNVQLKNLHSFHDSCKINNVKPSTDVIHVKETLANSADAEELFLTILSFVHGYASLLANGSVEYDEMQIKKMLVRLHTGLFEPKAGRDVSI